MGFIPKNILDIGAHHGNWSLYVNNIFPLANYELIEPIEYKELDRINYIMNMNHTNILLSDIEKEVKWYQKKNTGDSIYRENTNFFKDCEIIKKNTLTLDSVFKEKTFDLIKIDTQGSEIDILKGGINAMKKASFIILEMPFLGEYNKAAPDFYDHIIFMKEHGFVPYDIPEQHRVNGILIQIDIVFIKKTHPILSKVQNIINNIGKSDNKNNMMQIICNYYNNRSQESRSYLWNKFINDSPHNILDKYFKDHNYQEIENIYNQMKLYSNLSCEWDNYIKIDNNIIKKINQYNLDVDDMGYISNLGFNKINKNLLYNKSNQIISDSSIRAYYSSMICGKYLSKKKKNIFLEIGSGGSASVIFQLLKKYNSNINSILICDFTHILCLIYYNLNNNLKNIKILFYNKSHKQEINNLIDKYDIILISTDSINDFINVNIDLIYNSYSLSEMTPGDINNYLKFIANTSKYFISENKHYNRVSQSELFTPLFNFIPDSFKKIKETETLLNDNDHSIVEYDLSNCKSVKNEINNNLLVTTTYKNNFTLMKLFYKFYKKVWNPSNFLFIVGNTDGDKNKNISIINNILSIELKLLHNINFPNYSTVRNGILYKYDKIYVYIYDTQLKYESNFTWDSTRNFLLKNLHNGLENIGHPIFKHKYYINVDNDDLLYTNNHQHALNNNLNEFHTLEYIPNKLFEIEKPLKFISCPYYYLHKSNNSNLIDNQHTLCRFIDYKNPLGSCHHKMEQIHGKVDYDTCKNFDINNITHCCYAFGCPSLKSLIEEKHWQQTMINNGKMSMSTDTTKDKIEEDFHKYYSYESLTEKEKNNIPILETKLFLDIIKS